MCESQSIHHTLKLNGSNHFDTVCCSVGMSQDSDSDYMGESKCESKSEIHSDFCWTRTLTHLPQTRPRTLSNGLRQLTPARHGLWPDGLILRLGLWPRGLGLTAELTSPTHSNTGLLHHLIVTQKLPTLTWQDLWHKMTRAVLIPAHRSLPLSPSQNLFAPYW